ncbi:uncharacterized protein Nmag_1724 [Natrialba magadii ATCC 43099]|uniref:Uncharacterized protein n=1 Tax=Natrialba magadii (strain ATCC 43099 / DSM 3394 / CCM 3739 / CIP 104546 / IAM 13178 / JCM 8861 / NBRC 102185 / NCIMB 2190 / MS3) TaxID=547559 RepID=D3SUP2_NATMM|nr:hypothetical protein [Natrialba magadii]ADD05300.1 uncharacterized protein Nmag_1724 [Natrialba magadii ATCC 43099]ELY29151.1 hypothetical protein C500_11725 [Natrialba magadii ATCC 43099]
MCARYRNSAIGGRVAESVLAILAFLLAAGIVTESPILLDTVPELLWIPLSILVPGLLALTVLVSVLAHGIRLGSAVLDSGDRIQPGDTAVTRILASVMLGILAMYTLWWVVASLYVHYLAPTGGVSPAIWPPLFGGVLGALVLIQAVFFQLFPEGPLSRLESLSAG